MSNVTVLNCPYATKAELENATSLLVQFPDGSGYQVLELSSGEICETSIDLDGRVIVKPNRQAYSEWVSDLCGQTVKLIEVN